MKKITYKKAGVDIHSMDSFKHDIKGIVRKSFGPQVLKDIGGFGSFFALTGLKYKNPVLVSSADGVGTKIKIAVLNNIHNKVGIDAVGMNVNDILCTGAQPLFFLDYIAFSKLDKSALFDIVKGVNDGCIESGCALIGGETAQMPGMYKKSDYDLAGFCVGIVEKNNIIDGTKIAPNDIIIGLESSGLHSNGFSLVRKVLTDAELKRMAKDLLTPTRIYVKPVLSLLKSIERGMGSAVKGIAHITGGAFYDKIARILPSDVDALINKNSWVVPKLFRLIQNKGGIKDEEMYHTLNMGIGLILVVSPQCVQSVLAHFNSCCLKAQVIGNIVKGERKVCLK